MSICYVKVAINSQQCNLPITYGPHIHLTFKLLTYGVQKVQETLKIFKNFPQRPAASRMGAL